MTASRVVLVTIGTIALAFVRDVTAQRALWDDLSRVKADLEHELLQRQQLRALSEVYASGDAAQKFVDDFTAACVKVMELDRFDLR